MTWADKRIIVKDTLTNETLGFDTLDEASVHLGYTRERIRQIIVSHKLLQKRFAISVIESNKALSLH